MKKKAKKLVLAKETVQNLDTQAMKGVAGGSLSDCMRRCDSWWDCGAGTSQDTFC